MTKHYQYRYLFLILLLLMVSAGVLAYALHDEKVIIDSYRTIKRPARIRPDYSRTVIPPNIAPLNFRVCEQGSHYCVKIYSQQGPSIEVSSRSPKIIIPERTWHKILNMNRSGELYFDIFVKSEDDQWNLFPTISNKIAREDIDDFLVYRKMHPTHYLISGEVGLYQRNLHNYDESLILKNKYYRQGGCVNCHTFCNNRTDKTLIAVRSAVYGSNTILIQNNIAEKIGTKFTYASWHPSGKLASFSINNVQQFFHSARDEVREAIDVDSVMAYYLVDSKTVTTSPEISRKDRLETYPAWTPDGRYLYFCSAPMPRSSQEAEPQLEHYKEVRYDLVRISYDINTDSWGELETVLSARETNMSALLPRISPDGRWLLLCMSDYGCFPAFQQESDLYLVDLQAANRTGSHTTRRLEINSDRSESWHSWASNSRWIAFSSKRRDGVFTRPYLSYVDEAGKVCKPILLPQKDPTFFDSCLEAYNTPELVIQPVCPTGEKLARVVRSSCQITVDMPITMATPSAAKQIPPWQERE
jgi:hypothetical protein